MTRITEEEYVRARKIVELYEHQLYMDDLMSDPYVPRGTPYQQFERMLMHQLYIKLLDMGLVGEKRDVFELMKTRITRVVRHATPQDHSEIGGFYLDMKTPLLDFDYKNFTYAVK